MTPGAESFIIITGKSPVHFSVIIENFLDLQICGQGKSGAQEAQVTKTAISQGWDYSISPVSDETVPGAVEANHSFTLNLSLSL
jgi:hypothetical protein